MKKNSEKLTKCRKKSCGALFKMYNSLQPYCSKECFYSDKGTSTKKRNRITRIKPVSEKRQRENRLYVGKRIVFLSKKENQKCKIKSQKCTHKATTIEHSMGRVGYADNWSRNNNITLFLDERFWIASCLQCNLELENNPELSKKHQLSKIHGGKKL